MLAFLFNLIIILVVMKVCFKFMYPKPPQAFFPKEGDDITLRQCHHCGHHLATYRGILVQGEQEKFFCNEDHQQAFEAGESYR